MYGIGRPGALALPLLLLVLPLALLGGCGDGDGPGEAAAPGDAPQRIVSLSPTATEALFAIGAGERVVAVDEQSDFPPSAPRTGLSGFQPNVEAVAARRPDLVVVADEGTAAAVRGLRALGIAVLVQPAAASLAEAYAQIAQLGRIAERREAARRLVARMRERLARIVRGAPSGRGLRVYHELSPDYFSADSTTFIGRVYRLFGLANVADEAADAAGTGYPQLSAEHVVDSDPDLVVLADAECCGQTPAKARERPGWSGIAAVREGGVIAVDEDVASRWGPRVPRFAARVAAAIAAVRGAGGG